VQLTGEADGADVCHCETDRARSGKGHAVALYYGVRRCGGKRAEETGPSLCVKDVSSYKKKKKCSQLRDYLFAAYLVIHFRGLSTVILAADGRFNPELCLNDGSAAPIDDECSTTRIGGPRKSVVQTKLCLVGIASQPNQSGRAIAGVVFVGPGQGGEMMIWIDQLRFAATQPRVAHTLIVRQPLLEVSAMVKTHGLSSR